MTDNTLNSQSSTDAETHSQSDTGSDEPDVPPVETDAHGERGVVETDYSDMSASAVQVTSQKGNDERGTPVTFIRKLQDAIGGLFDLDPCSGAEPQPIAHTRFTKEDNGLAQDWRGYDTVYVNPPYSDLKRWLQKVEREATRDDPEAPGLVMCLLPGNTSTQWFQQYATRGDYLCLIEGRLTFHGTKQSAPFASILVIFGDPNDDVLQTLERVGTTYTRAEIEEADRQARLDELLETDGGGVVPAGPPAAPIGMDGPESPAGPETLPGPTILDVSDDAPAVPQGVIDFYDIGIGDWFYIELDDSTLGFPHNAPTSGRVKVLAGEPATQYETQTPTHWNTITCIDPETDTWFVLCQNPDDIRDVRCSIAIDGADWIDVDLSALHRLTSQSIRAIEPYGEGTSWVC